VEQSAARLKPPKAFQAVLSALLLFAGAERSRWKQNGGDPSRRSMLHRYLMDSKKNCQAVGKRKAG
jgi:hypothetical protein